MLANPLSLEELVMKIDVAKQFYKRPAGRVKEEGKYTGEHFREMFLAKAMKDAIDNHEELVVDFTGTTMAGSSFLDEAFGGLVRQEKLKKDDILKYLKIVHVSGRTTLSDTIIKYIKAA